MVGTVLRDPALQNSHRSEHSTCSGGLALINMALPNKHASKSTPDSQSSAWQKIKYQLAGLLSCEIYFILLLAGFLRLYQLNTSEFEGDQVVAFGLAREALHSGLLPIVSNQA